jgi:YHS domain-containing protein
MMTRLASQVRQAAFALTFSLAASAAAAEAPLNKTADGIAMDGFDVVAYSLEGAPAKGSAEHAVEHQGATWLFASAEHADLFRADPAKYAPVYNGWCSYAASEGYGAEVDFVNGWAVIDGALYLNWDKSVRDLFVSEQAQRIPAGQSKWVDLAKGLADGTAEFYPHSSDPSVGISHPQQLN